jgi:ADP-heptose:LPS heptosyltransferase
MRILVIRRGAIGDVIVTLPTVEILRKNYPDAYMEVIGNPGYWEIAYKRGYIDAVSKGDTSLVPELYVRDRKLSKEASDYFSAFDLIIGYASDPEGIVTENLRKTGAKRVITCHPFPKEDNLHAADYTALVLREIGLEVSPPLIPRIYLKEEDLYFASRFLSSIDFKSKETHSNASLQSEFGPNLPNKPLVAIHPRTHGVKGLPIEKFINIGHWIDNTFGATTIWITGQAEEENTDMIKSNFPSSPLLHLHALPKVAAVLSLSDLYFGCDTGISHLAAAAGVRVLALFGPTDPNVWGPRGKRVWIIKANDMSKFKEDILKDAILGCSRGNDLEEYKILHV